MKFIDEVQLNISSGNGGPGCISFRREKYLPRGGPDGGNGGRGGHVIFKVNSHKTTLLDLKYRNKVRAGNGKPGEGQNCTGADGDDLYVEVPPGTVIKNMATGEILDLTGKEEVMYLQGGRGGKGNWHFRSSVNQTPDHAQPGEEGLEAEILMQLKLIADVGLLGFPNVGKSTLISRMSAAKPKIADYPFTTLVPNLGVVDLGQGRQLVVADIPGIIEGAHQGTGLGIKFLKHIERTKLFLHVIDCSGMTGRDPFEDFNVINNELRKYDEQGEDLLGGRLMDRKQIIVLNKIDSISQDDQDYFMGKFLSEYGDQYQVCSISAVTGQGVDQLLTLLSKTVYPEEDDPSQEIR